MDGHNSWIRLEFYVYLGKLLYNYEHNQNKGQMFIILYMVYFICGGFTTCINAIIQNVILIWLNVLKIHPGMFTLKSLKKISNGYQILTPTTPNRSNPNSIFGFCLHSKQYNEQKSRQHGTKTRKHLMFQYRRVS